MKKLVVAVLVLSVLSTANAQDVDTSNYAQLDYDSITVRYILNNGVFKGRSKPTSISMTEVAQIEFLLRKCTDEYKEAEYKKYKDKRPDLKKDDYLYELNKYKRQIIAVTTEKNEKIAWVNCFVPRYNEDGTIYDNWRHDARIVLYEGGKAYFNVKMNLSANTYFDLFVNGN